VKGMLTVWTCAVLSESEVKVEAVSETLGSLVSLSSLQPATRVETTKSARIMTSSLIPCIYNLQGSIQVKSILLESVERLKQYLAIVRFAENRKFQIDDHKTSIFRSGAFQFAELKNTGPCNMKTPLSRVG
jgi:hypothetical protein